MVEMFLLRAKKAQPSYVNLSRMSKGKLRKHRRDFISTDLGKRGTLRKGQSGFPCSGYCPANWPWISRRASVCLYEKTHLPPGETVDVQKAAPLRWGCNRKFNQKKTKKKKPWNNCIQRRNQKRHSFPKCFWCFNWNDRCFFNKQNSAKNWDCKS